MLAGTVFEDRFELEELAASGGMGRIYRALDRTTGARVAVKLLLDGPPTDAARFGREAQALAGLVHPSIVRYVAHGVSPDGRPWLAMEWLDGEDLKSRLLRGRLDFIESVRLGRRVAEALAVAHARGAVHRDLKPANIFLVDGRADDVRILDFGVALLGDQSRVTRTGAILGTPAYMAPEQVRGLRSIDARADVFALGCVLFECLTGGQAYGGDHFTSVLARILFADAPRLGELLHGVPAELDDLVARMLAKDPALRPRDGAAVAAELGLIEHVLTGGETPLPRPPSGPTALGAGERREVAVIFLAPKETPGDSDATVQLSSDTRLRAAAATHGGRYEHLADGSDVVTITGAGVATDLAARAARTALALAACAPERHVTLAMGLAQLAGLGAAHGGGSGSESGARRASGTPVGDTIDRAARMLTSRPPAPPRVVIPIEGVEVAIDEVTAGLLDARFDVKEVEGGLVLRGERPLAEGARTLLGRPTACVGRDREIATLVQLFNECVDEPVAQAAIVVAPAGVGKSRLAYEVIREIRRRDDAPAIWIARADPQRAGSVFGLLAQALRGALDIAEGEPLEVRREKLRDGVARRVNVIDAPRVTEFLGEILGAPMPDEGSVALREARKDPQIMAEQTRRAWEDFLAAECAARPVLLVLEDLHWGDRPTVRLVDIALRDLRDRPWMVLALARPEVSDHFPRLWADRRLHEVRLKELSRKASERLIHQVLGAAVAPGDVERIVALADGNAFYLEELIRATSEQRGGTLPETVVAMVQSRLAALDDDARRALRAASVFGESFWPGGVAALLGGPVHAQRVERVLTELTEREVLVTRPEGRFPGERELAFRHALLREGAYATLTEEDRALGHRLAGAWLEAMGERDAMVLAEHFEHGGEPQRACAHYRRAAEQALWGGDAESALTRAKRGLACGADGDARVDLLRLLVEGGSWTNAFAASLPWATELMAIAAPGSGPWATAVMLRFLLAIMTGAADELRAMLALLMDVDPQAEAIDMYALSLSAGTFLFDLLGRFEPASALFARLAQAVAPFEREAPVAAGWRLVTEAQRALWVAEDPWAARPHALAARACFESAGHVQGTAIADMWSGLAAYALGDLATAERELLDTYGAEERIGLASGFRTMGFVWLLLARGATDEARRYATGLVMAGRAWAAPVDEGRGQAALADVLVREGDFAGAEQAATRAAELLEVPAPFERASSLATRAEALLRAGRVAEARAVAEEAHAAYAALGGRGSLRGAYIRLVRAEALHAAGEAAAAKAAIAEARARIDEGEQRIGEEAARSGYRARPEHARTLALAEAWLAESA